MTESKLSPSERMILDYIKYRCNKNKFFFGSNGHIATYIGLKPNSAKVLVNGLIRKGYLERTDDGTHQRTLQLTGKEYLPITGCNMSDMDKSGLKKERDEYKKEYDHLDKWNKELISENNQLKKKVSELEKYVSDINTQLEKEFIPDYQAKIARVKELEKKMGIL